MPGRSDASLMNHSVETGHVLRRRRAPPLGHQQGNSVRPGQEGMEPPVGIEPTTYSFRAGEATRMGPGASWCNSACEGGSYSATRPLEAPQGASKRVTNVSIEDGAPLLPLRRSSRLAGRSGCIPVAPTIDGASAATSRINLDRSDRQDAYCALGARGHLAPRPPTRERRTAMNQPGSVATGTPTTDRLSAEDPLLTPEEVSEMLGVPPATLKRWRTQRTGPAPLHIGRYVRYRRSGVETWLCEKDAEAAAWMAS